jgi:tetratricopeptide (TPR) repeat protein
MTGRRDLWDIAVTAEADAAVDAWNDTLLAYMGMRVDIGDRLKGCFAADPEMPMALVAKGAFLKMFATAKMDGMARETVVTARHVFERRGATEREHRHLDALAAWARGDMEGACALWDAILVDHPRDVLALKLAQLNRFYIGVPTGMRDAFARTWHAWDEAVPAYGFIAGSYAFGLEEAGDLDRAEALGRRAVEINPADVWAAHAVAHVHESRADPAAGLAWLDGLRDQWAEVHNFKHHAHWHRGLFALDSGDADRALAIFDADVWTDTVEDYLDLSNGASLLWRLAEQGASLGDRPGRVADLAERLAFNHALAFSDCHVAVALALDGRVEMLSSFLADLDKAARRAAGTQARVLEHVARGLCDAAAADAAGEAGEACALLLAARHSLHRIGGSFAQRDLFERMLVANAIKAGRVPLARALISERLEVRPGDSWAGRKWDAVAAG